MGIIYQINVIPLKHRHLIGAMLVKAAFEKAANGCKLFSCWCAQDMQANWFWESLGFVALAFRTGSRGKQRTHIFWQKRIREGDIATPWWFPSQTKSGSFREDRLAFPIPANVHWRDPMPIVLPELEAAPVPKTMPGGAPVRPRPEHTLAEARAKSRYLKGTPIGMAAVVTANGIRHVPRADHVPEAKPKRVQRAPAPKHDPKHIALARELRDRFLEQVSADPSLLLPAGKYEVARALPDLSAPGPASPRAAVGELIEVKALPAAA